MAHFYGSTQGRAGEATRLGTATTGLTSTAAGWHGAIEVRVDHDSEEKRDYFHVWLIPWQSSDGEAQLLATGPLDSTVKFGNICTERVIDDEDCFTVPADPYRSVAA
jgi:hypothetical protein